jgi:predicted dithiol-disulfide oxidoreductase (DUF899 family)
VQRLEHASSADRGVQGEDDVDDAVRIVARHDVDQIYRTYATTSRGVDRLLFSSNIMDLLPYGRQQEWEDSPPGWPQHPTYGRI